MRSDCFNEELTKVKSNSLVGEYKESEAHLYSVYSHLANSSIDSSFSIPPVPFQKGRGEHTTPPIIVVLSHPDAQTDFLHCVSLCSSQCQLQTHPLSSCLEMLWTSLLYIIVHHVNVPLCC